MLRSFELEDRGKLMGLFDFFKIKSSRKKLEELYTSNNYSRMPYLPSEEECSRILKEYRSFPATLVAKEYMSSLDSEYKLIFGHIIMLWWLSNSKTNKNNIPKYFLYQYGLDFQNEINYLNEKKILNGWELTNLGKEQLEKYNEIVRKHRARKSYDVEGKIIYHFEDTDRVSKVASFKSTGDYVEDQFLGKSFEQAKSFDNAELAYLSAIKISLAEGEIPPPNPFMRLAIIYRKQKRISDEEEILRQGLYYLEKSSAGNAKSKCNVFQERLNKLRKIKE
ncbi:hypothetical protein ACVRW7_08090 [Streptococcus ratti]